VHIGRSYKKSIIATDVNTLADFTTSWPTCVGYNAVTYLRIPPMEFVFELRLIKRKTIKNKQDHFTISSMSIIFSETFKTYCIRYIKLNSKTFCLFDQYGFKRQWSDRSFISVIHIFRRHFWSENHFYYIFYIVLWLF